MLDIVASWSTTVADGVIDAELARELRAEQPGLFDWKGQLFVEEFFGFVQIP